MKDGPKAMYVLRFVVVAKITITMSFLKFTWIVYKIFISEFTNNSRIWWFMITSILNWKIEIFDQNIHYLDKFFPCLSFEDICTLIKRWKHVKMEINSQEPRMRRLRKVVAWWWVCNPLSLQLKVGGLWLYSPGDPPPSWYRRLPSRQPQTP